MTRQPNRAVLKQRRKKPVDGAFRVSGRVDELGEAEPTSGSREAIKDGKPLLESIGSSGRIGRREVP
jgi:hypothetical protein